MKVGCVLVTRFPIQVERMDDPTLVGVPLVIGGRRWDLGAVSACCERAAAAGVHTGMRLAQAEALCPAATFLPGHETRYHALNTELATAAGQFAPLVETANLGLFYAALDGLNRVVGSDERLARQLVVAVAASGLPVRVGLAGNKFCAEQAARAARPGDVCLIPAGEERAFLAALSLDSLPFDLEMHRRLALLGIHTLGQFAALPRLALIRQFGPQAGPLHDLARGCDPRPVRADPLPLLVERQQLFDEPCANWVVLERVLQLLAAELGADLSRGGYQAEGVRLSLIRATGKREIAGAAVKPPSARPERLVRLAGILLARLAQLQEGPHAGVSELVFCAYPLRPAHLGATQLTLLENARDRRRDRLREVLRGLRNRFGDLVITMAALLGPPPALIQVTAGADGVPRGLVWRDRIWRVVAVYECWREHRRWWGRPVVRDYYRLELDDGQVRVVFCDLRSGQWQLERRHI